MTSHDALHPFVEFLSQVAVDHCRFGQDQHASIILDCLQQAEVQVKLLLHTEEYNSLELQLAGAADHNSMPTDSVEVATNTDLCA